MYGYLRINRRIYASISHELNLIGAEELSHFEAEIIDSIRKLLIAKQDALDIDELISNLQSLPGVEVGRGRGILIPLVSPDILGVFRLQMPWGDEVEFDTFKWEWDLSSANPISYEIIKNLRGDLLLSRYLSLIDLQKLFKKYRIRVLESTCEYAKTGYLDRFNYDAIPRMPPTLSFKRGPIAIGISKDFPKLPLIREAIDFCVCKDIRRPVRRSLLVPKPITYTTIDPAIVGTAFDYAARYIIAGTHSCTADFLIAAASRYHAVRRSDSSRFDEIISYL